MATLFELKEHLKKGGKIKRYSWEEGEWIKLIGNTFVDEDGVEFPFSPEDALYCSWEVYKEPFKITHTGLYKTRDGRKVFISRIKRINSELCVASGVIENENIVRCWPTEGTVEEDETALDIVAEWKD